MKKPNLRLMEQVCIPTLLNNINTMVLLVSKDYTIVDFNLAAKNFFQSVSDEIVGKNFFALTLMLGAKCSKSEDFHEESTARFEMILEQSISNRPFPRVFSWLFVTADTNVKDGSSGFLILGTDITAQRHFGEAIVLENILRYMPLSVFWKDKEGRYLGCSQYTAEMAGLEKREDIVGLTDADLPWKDIAEEVRATDKRIFDSNKPVVLEEVTSYRDIALLSHKVVLKDFDNRNMGILGVSVDITNQRTAEKQLIIAKEKAEAANQTKTEFIQNMQHDIRTPASGIYGLLTQLLQDENNPDRKETIAMLTKASQNLLDLCNDIVSLDDIEQGKLVTERIVDIRKMAQKIIDLNKPAAFKKGLILKLKIDKNIPENLFLDEFRLHRILINLIGNAIKFTDKGSVSLFFNAQIAEKRNGILCIEVKDTGIGIDLNKADFIFEKFTRLIPSNTNKYPGTGLGLYIIKKFVQDLDGDLRVDSRIGEGSCFSVLIPFKVPLEDQGKKGILIDEEFIASTKKAKAASKKVKAAETVVTASDKIEDNNIFPFSHRVLLIEDDKMCLLIQKKILFTLTKNVDIAESVFEARNKLDQNRYDIVISDLGLPDGTGIDIISSIKQNVACQNYPTPFVALTAHQNLAMHQSAMSAGFLEVATKPLSEERARAFLSKYSIVDQGIVKKGVDLPIIDIVLGMKRISAKNPKDAINLLKLLFDTLDQDINVLKEAQQRGDTIAIRKVLHKMHGGLCYTGTPRLEMACKQLHDAVKSTDDLKKVVDLFDHVYDEVQIFKNKYKDEFGNSV